MLHYEILDATRQALLPQVATIGSEFYLAGGTALALQIGHRDSVDFDFFINDDIDTHTLWQNIETVFAGQTLLKTQDEKNTLSCTIAGEVRLSFFGYRYPLLTPLIIIDDFNLASIAEIGTMKLSAITSRSTFKDYIDLYYILQKQPLADLLALCHKKFPTLDQTLILKSLVYFDDITPEPIRFMPGFEIAQLAIESSMKTTVREYLEHTA